MSEQELTQLCRCADPIRCEMANRIHELEARIKLAIQLDYAGYIGYVTPALRGQDISSNVIKRMKLILKQEGRKQSDE